MKTTNSRFFRYLSRLNTRMRGGIPLKNAFNEPPLRSELYSADQMEQRGKYLATIHNLTQERPQDRLMKRLAENEAVLIDVCGRLTTTV